VSLQSRAGKLVSRALSKGNSTYVDCDVADNRGMVGKSNVFVFIVNAILACTILLVDLIVDYEGALDVDLN
jgi:tRNA(Ser,Leu) C12 N-acetylase TAN1